LREDIARGVEEILREITGVYEFDIETMAVVEGYVHIFLSTPPKYPSMLLGQ